MRKSADIFVAVSSFALFTCFIVGTLTSKGDCADTYIVRGVEYEKQLNQDSLNEIEYRRKADSMIAAAKSKFNHAHE